MRKREATNQREGNNSAPAHDDDVSDLNDMIADISLEMKTRLTDTAHARRMRRASRSSDVDDREASSVGECLGLS